MHIEDGPSDGIALAGVGRVTTYPPLRAVLWLMSLLFLSANLYNIDRLIMGVLAEQIRADIRVSEVQMSLLIGAAYGLLSGTLGVFLGFYVDRANRSRVIAISLLVWSLATIGGGLSAGFGGLFLARALVGLGEAALAPAAMSLIADMFPPGRRGRALGVYSMGATLGSALSAIIPGLIVGMNLHVAAPGLGLLPPWRTTFVLCGFGGIGIAALMFTTREPARQGPTAVVQRGRARFASNVTYMSSQGLLFVPFLLGPSIFSVPLSAITAWTTVFLARHFGVPLNRFSGVLGLTLLATGVAGYLFGGFIIDTKPMRPSITKLALMMIAPLFALPSALAVFAPSLPTAVLMLGAITFVAPVVMVSNGALVQDFLPNNMRGFGLSLMTMTASILGVGVAPLLVALATEHLFKRPELIGYSMLLVSVPGLAATMACYGMAIVGVRRHVAKGSPVKEIMRAADAL